MAKAKIQLNYTRELGEEFGLTGGADEQGEYEVKPYLVDWDDRGNFINQVMATSSVSGGLNGQVTYYNAYQLPDNPRLYAKTCTWEPEGKLIPQPDGTIAYSHAVVRVTFRQPSWNYSPQDDPQFFNSLSQDPGENEALLNCTQEVDFAKETMTIPSSSVKWKSDGKTVHGTSLSRSVTVVTMYVTFHHYPILPMSVLREYADSVNDATFLGCAKGTVFFEGPKAVREKMSDGQVTQRLQLTFKWREYDWNKSIRADGLSWDFPLDNRFFDPPNSGGPTSDHSGFARYTYKNFRNLLQLIA